MEININNKKNATQNYIKFIIQKVINTKKKFYLLFLLFFIILFLPLDLGINKNNKFLLSARQKTILLFPNIFKYFGNEQLSYIAKETIEYGDNLFNIGKRYINSNLKNNVPIYLDINFKDLEKLRKIRNDAINNKILLRKEDDEVNALLSHKGKTYPVKIRLKGDWTDHLLGNKWSFKVNVRKNKSFKGLKEFSLQHPRTRNYLNEYLFQTFLKYEKAPYLRYDFVELKLNGESLGTYAIEEHFTKNLIENSGFREGPIIKISEQDLWKDRKDFIQITNEKFSTDLYNENNAEINSFNMNKLTSNEILNSQLFTAKSILEEFLRKEIKADKVFEIKNTAIFYAISDLFASRHGQIWNNFRFYYDPVVSKLIPIGFDAEPPIRQKDRKLSIDKNTFNIFDNIKITEEYVRNLEKISTKSYLDKIIEKNRININEKLETINKSYPHVLFLKDELIKSQKYIKKRLRPKDPIDVYYFKNIKEDTKFRLFNKNQFPIEVISLSINDKKYIPKKKIILRGSSRYLRKKYEIFEFKELVSNSNKKIPDNLIKLEFKLLGSNFIQSSLIKNKIFYNPSTANISLIKREPNYSKYKFLFKDKNTKAFILKSGEWTISEPLILPNDYSLIIEEGAKIILKNKGLIFVNGDIQTLGTKLKPVIFEASEGGKGLLIINARKKSNLINTKFINLSSPNIDKVNITGAITFYNSPVNINHSFFSSNFSEDSLNIIRSNFKISNSSFLNSFSDALDLDSSNGEIYNISFKNIGNDAIDISNGEVLINQLKINNSPDKAISIGEKSLVDGSEIFIDRSGIGIASKDLSTISLRNIIIKNTDVCFTSFQKKNEYGPASINVLDDKSVLSCEKEYLLEKGSSITVKDKKYLPNSISVKELLYGNIFGKSSK